MLAPRQAAAPAESGNARRFQENCTYRPAVRRQNPMLSREAPPTAIARARSRRPHRIRCGVNRGHHGCGQWRYTEHSLPQRPPRLPEICQTNRRLTDTPEQRQADRNDESTGPRVRRPPSLAVIPPMKSANPSLQKSGWEAGQPLPRRRKSPISRSANRGQPQRAPGARHNEKKQAQPGNFVWEKAR